MTIYKNRTEWRGGHLGFLHCQNGVSLEFSAPPDLHGASNVLTPEDAFLAAANTCYFLMVVWAAERFGIKFISFACEAEGVVETFFDKTSWFKVVTLCPEVEATGVSLETVKRALDLALKYSTICQSLKSEVRVKPTIIIR